MEERRYGLFMAVAMIVGIVIGSGIFFKADDILFLTNGNIALGCLVLSIGAVGIIFGGITLAKWATVSDDAGGLITYSEKAYGNKVAFLVGWFMMVVYFPSIVAVIAHVSANYTLQLFPFLYFNEYSIWLFTIIYILLIYSINTYAIKISTFLQTSSLIIKMIPLIIFGIVGIIFGDTSNFDFSNITSTALFASSNAIIAAAFSYDGWTIAPSICHEIKNSKVNLPLALTMAPIIILILYIMFFVGISFILTPQEIMKLQDAAFNVAAIKVFGPNIAKLMLIMVIISVLGTLNGVILGSCRIPYALAIRKELPNSDKISHINPKYKISIKSHLISFIFSLIWLLLHYLSIENNYINQFQFDVSSIPIVIMHIIYLSLYISVMIYTYKGYFKGIISGYLCPILASISALLVIISGLTSSNGPLYLLISFISIISGLIISKNVQKK